MVVVVSAFAAATPAQTSKEGNASATAPATDLRFRSALERYQPYKEQPVQSWRDANDNVGRIGGWRVYAKEAAAPEAGAATELRTDPHTGHHPRGKQ